MDLPINLAGGVHPATRSTTLAETWGLRLIHEATGVICSAPADPAGGNHGRTDPRAD